MNLIEKLKDYQETIAVLRNTEEQGSYEFTLLGYHLLGVKKAIDIVKQHQQQQARSKMETNGANQVKYIVGSGGNISFYPAVDYDKHTAFFVRCNQCMSLGYAWYGDEICPVCGEYGAIMDLEEVQDA